MALQQRLSQAQHGLTTIVVPKNRRPKFELLLRIIDLNNVPLVSGASYIKWHLPASAAADHRGRTSRCQIREHRVCYDYEKRVALRLTMDRNGLLQESAIEFEVLQEYSTSGRGERIILGNVKLNLAEYVDADDNAEYEGVCRRYLMQDSKINSTLKVGIHMKHLEGDKNYTAPPLKTAPVFGGIAGIIAGEQGEPDDVGHMPSTMSSKSREHREFQDMYRRNLAAFWTALPGEPRADECIEDIFSGGDGWVRGKDHVVESTSKQSADGDRQQTKHSHRRSQSGGNGLFKSPPMTSSAGGKFRSRRHEQAPSGSGVSGRASLEQHANNMKAEAAVTKESAPNEVDEFDLRDNLRSWKLPGAVGG